MKTDLRFIMMLWMGTSLAACSSHSPVGAVNASDSPQVRPDFSGQWILNTKASDNPQDAAKEAMQASRMPMGGGQGMGGGRGKGGGKGGGMGGGQHKQGMSQDSAKRSEMYRQMLPLLDTAETLGISHQEPILLIGSGSAQQQRIFTDFSGASVSSSGGPQQRVTVAGWEGTVLVVETTLNSGSRLVQHYQLDTSTDQLMIDNAIQLEERKPVSFQLVYDREVPPN